MAIVIREMEDYMQKSPKFYRLTTTMKLTGMLNTEKCQYFWTHLYKKLQSNFGESGLLQFCDFASMEVLDKCDNELAQVAERCIDTWQFKSNFLDKF